MTFLYIKGWICSRGVHPLKGFVIERRLLGGDKWAKLRARCLKITEIVSFNIASEASYVYILSGQKFI